MKDKGKEGYSLEKIQWKSSLSNLSKERKLETNTIKKSNKIVTTEIQLSMILHDMKYTDN